MARQGENIRKRKDGRWEGQYSRKNAEGQNAQGSVFSKTYQEAKEKLIQSKAMQKEQAQELKKCQTLEDSFAETAKEWFDTAWPTLKPSSAAKYRNILENHLLPCFGLKKTQDISRDELMTFLSGLLVSGGVRARGLSPKTVTDILSVMKNVMNYARYVKGMSVMNFTGIAVKQPQKRLRVFSHIEWQTLSVYLLNHLSLPELGILLCLYTGLRIGEICALTWGDISFTEQKLHIAKTMQRIQLPKGSQQKTEVIITQPKSDCSIRDIPIPDPMFRILSEMRKPNNGFFLTGQKNVFIEPRTLENRFNSVTKACGITDATMHTCRHSFATRCIELGFDVKTLSEILGHASVTITMNRYVHPSMEMKQQNMDKLSYLLKIQ